MFILIGNKRVNTANIVSYYDTTKNSVDEKILYGICFQFGHPIVYGTETREIIWYKTSVERDEKIQSLDKICKLSKIL